MVVSAASHGVLVVGILCLLFSTSLWSSSCAASPTSSPARVACSAGQFKSAGRCASCPAGSFNDQPITFSKNCSSCAVGFYAPNTGMTTCLPCAAGYFADSTGAVACTPCLLGSVAPAPGSASCQSCAPGTYAGTYASLSCQKCSVGSFSSSHGAASCTACAYPSITRTVAATGVAECNALTLALPSFDSALLFGLMVIAFSIAVASSHSQKAALAMNLFLPTLDILSDLGYLVTVVYYHSVLFALTFLSFCIPVGFFMFKLFSLNALPYINIPALRQVLWLGAMRASHQQVPRDQEHDQTQDDNDGEDHTDTAEPTFAAEIESSFIFRHLYVPTYFGQPQVDLLHNTLHGDSATRLRSEILLALSWVPASMAQAIHLLLWAVGAVVYVFFLTAWFALGAFLYWTKLLSVPSVWNAWFLVWTSDGQTYSYRHRYGLQQEGSSPNSRQLENETNAIDDASNPNAVVVEEEKEEVDTAAINLVYWRQLHYQVIPAFLFQTANNASVKQWSGVYGFAYAVTIITLIFGMYRFYVQQLLLRANGLKAYPISKVPIGLDMVVPYLGWSCRLRPPVNDDASAMDSKGTGEKTDDEEQITQEGATKEELERFTGNPNAVDADIESGDVYSNENDTSNCRDIAGFDCSDNDFMHSDEQQSIATKHVSPKAAVAVSPEASRKKAYLESPSFIIRMFSGAIPASKGIGNGNDNGKSNITNKSNSDNAKISSLRFDERAAVESDEAKASNDSTEGATTVQQIGSGSNLDDFGVVFFEETLAPAPSVVNASSHSNMAIPTTDKLSSQENTRHTTTLTATADVGAVITPSPLSLLGGVFRRLFSTTKLANFSLPVVSHQPDLQTELQTEHQTPTYILQSDMESCVDNTDVDTPYMDATVDKAKPEVVTDNQGTSKPNPIMTKQETRNHTNKSQHDETINNRAHATAHASTFANHSDNSNNVRLTPATLPSATATIFTATRSTTSSSRSHAHSKSHSHSSRSSNVSDVMSVVRQASSGLTAVTTGLRAPQQVSNKINGELTAAAISAAVMDSTNSSFFARKFSDTASSQKNTETIFGSDSDSDCDSFISDSDNPMGSNHSFSGDYDLDNISLAFLETEDIFSLERAKQAARKEEEQRLLEVALAEAKAIEDAKQAELNQEIERLKRESEETLAAQRAQQEQLTQRLADELAARDAEQARLTSEMEALRVKKEEENEQNKAMAQAALDAEIQRLNAAHEDQMRAERAEQEQLAQELLSRQLSARDEERARLAAEMEELRAKQERDNEMRELSAKQALNDEIARVKAAHEEQLQREQAAVRAEAEMQVATRDAERARLASEMEALRLKQEEENERNKAMAQAALNAEIQRLKEEHEEQMRLQKEAHGRQTRNVLAKQLAARDAEQARLANEMEALRIKQVEESEHNKAMAQAALNAEIQRLKAEHTEQLRWQREEQERQARALADELRIRDVQQSQVVRELELLRLRQASEEKQARFAAQEALQQEIARIQQESAAALAATSFEQERAVQSLVAKLAKRDMHHAKMADELESLKAQLAADRAKEQEKVEKERKDKEEAEAALRVKAEQEWAETLKNQLASRDEQQSRLEGELKSLRERLEAEERQRALSVQNKALLERLEAEERQRASSVQNKAIVVPTTIVTSKDSSNNQPVVTIPHHELPQVPAGLHNTNADANSSAHEDRLAGLRAEAARMRAAADEEIRLLYAAIEEQRRKNAEELRREEEKRVAEAKEIQELIEAESHRLREAEALRRRLELELSQGRVLCAEDLNSVIPSLELTIAPTDNHSNAAPDVCTSASSLTADDDIPVLLSMKPSSANHQTRNNTNNNTKAAQNLDTKSLLEAEARRVTEIAKAAEARRSELQALEARNAAAAQAAILASQQQQDRDDQSVAAVSAVMQWQQRSHHNGGGDDVNDDASVVDVEGDRVKHEGALRGAIESAFILKTHLLAISSGERQHHHRSGDSAKNGDHTSLQLDTAEGMKKALKRFKTDYEVMKADASVLKSKRSTYVAALDTWAAWFRDNHEGRDPTKAEQLETVPHLVRSAVEADKEYFQRVQDVEEFKNHLRQLKADYEGRKVEDARSRLDDDQAALDAWCRWYLEKFGRQSTRKEQQLSVPHLVAAVEKSERGLREALEKDGTRERDRDRDGDSHMGRIIPMATAVPVDENDRQFNSRGNSDPQQQARHSLKSHVSVSNKSVASEKQLVGSSSSSSSLRYSSKTSALILKGKHMKTYLESSADRIVIPSTAKTAQYSMLSKTELRVGQGVLVIHPRLPQTEKVSLTDVLAKKAVFNYHGGYVDKVDTYTIVELEREPMAGTNKNSNNNEGLNGASGGRLRLKRQPSQHPCDTMPDECICHIPERCVALQQ